MNWKKVISIVLIGVLGLMCMTACQATAGTSEENHVPDTSTAAQENADNQVTEDETSGRTIVVYYSWSENTKSIAKRIAETTGADIGRNYTPHTCGVALCRELLAGGSMQS